MLNCSASLTMSTSVLKALPGKLDIKRHSPSILCVHRRRILYNGLITKDKQNALKCDCTVF